VTLPDEGRIGFFNAPLGMEDCAIAPARLHAVQSFKPDFDRLDERGIPVSLAPEGPYAGVVVQMPRAKALARELLVQAWQSCAPGGLIMVDGQKTEGIDGIAKELKVRLGHVGSFAKAHGKLIWAERSDDAAALDGLAPAWCAAPEGFVTAPGVFSADRVDAGSRLLLANLPALKGRVADLGAGWGYLSAHILKSDAVATLELIEADHAALDCARRNVCDARATFHWADATVFKGGPYDTVVMNPPFHVTRAAEPDLGVAFIQSAACGLHGSGALWLVANRQLPYEGALDKAFRRVEMVTSNATFKVIHARGPRRSK